VLQSLQERFPQVELYIPKSFWAGVEYNIKYAVNAALSRISRKLKPFDLRFIPLFRPELRKYNPDVVISQGSLPRNTYNIPVIWEILFIDPVSFRGGDNSEEAWLRRVSEYRQMAHLAAILGVRDYYSIDLIRKLIPDHASKARFLPFYLPDLEPLDVNAIKEKHNNCEKLKLLFVGGQAIRKGLPKLIEAVRMAKRQTSKEFLLTVVSVLKDGKVTIPSDLPVVHYRGLPHAKVIQLFKESHIYIMPSKIESFGISYIEGMANGCAVIARNFQPQRDIMDDGQSGMLAPPDDIPAIADAIVTLCENDELRLKIALGGVEKFKRAYYWRAVAPMWIEAIEAAKKI
jgi:glycosyltransferase involved in cell wall biosynthesis